jgi:hypothetical protein
LLSHTFSIYTSSNAIVEFFQIGEMGQVQHVKDNALIENKTTKGKIYGKYT